MEKVRNILPIITTLSLVFVLCSCGKNHEVSDSGIQPCPDLPVVDIGKLPSNWTVLVQDFLDENKQDLIDHFLGHGDEEFILLVLRRPLNRHVDIQLSLDDHVVHPWLEGNTVDAWNVAYILPADTMNLTLISSSMNTDIQLDANKNGIEYFIILKESEPMPSHGWVDSHIRM